MPHVTTTHFRWQPTCRCSNKAPLVSNCALQSAHLHNPDSCECVLLVSLTSSFASCFAGGNLIVFGCDKMGDFCDGTVASSPTSTSKLSLNETPLSDDSAGEGDLSSTIVDLLTTSSIGGRRASSILAVGVVAHSAVFGCFAESTVGTAVSTLSVAPFSLEGNVFNLTIGTTVAFNLTQLKLFMIFCTGCITFKQGVRLIMGMVLLLLVIVANCGTKMLLSGGLGALVWRYVKFGGKLTAVNVTVGAKLTGG